MYSVKITVRGSEACCIYTFPSVTMRLPSLVVETFFPEKLACKCLRAAGTNNGSIEHVSVL